MQVLRKYLCNFILRQCINTTDNLLNAFKSKPKFDLMKTFAVVSLFGLLCLNQLYSQAIGDPLPAGITRLKSELTIDREVLIPAKLGAPVPQGKIDQNPPWLHVNVPIVPEGSTLTNQQKKALVMAEKWKRCFYFKLSKDPQFNSGVIQSGPKKWSFFNPFQRLSTGTWYWRFGIAPANAPGQPVWQPTTFSFTITGQERAAELPPTPDQLVSAIDFRPTGPITIMRESDIGNVLPTSVWPELAAQITDQIEDALASGSTPVTITPNASYASMVLFSQDMKGKFTNQERRVVELLRGYLLTGNPAYRTFGLARAAELEQLRQTAHWMILGQDKYLKDDAHYSPLPFIAVDCFLSNMPASQQQTFAALVREIISTPTGEGPDLHEHLEHVQYDNHKWQQGMKHLLMGSIILCRTQPEFKEWVKYAYELWLYRSPAFSRTDGGSSEGNGYLGVHDDSLTHIPWVLYQLTGHNYYRSKTWFDNFTNYLSYSNTEGNPGVSFEDSASDNGTRMPHLSEMLAYLRPDIASNLWWFENGAGETNVSSFARNLNEGNHAWDLLLLWKQVQAPNTQSISPPVKKGAVFRDVGLACMHTNLTDSTSNLMLNFRAGPYGSSQHTHPAQNAFTIAYGGQPLFWRTGYYNGGMPHNVLSYKCSRAHNTIMAGGMVQGFDPGAYAWMARFVNGERISYALGDASHAYNGKHQYFNVGVDTTYSGEGDVLNVTSANGFGNPGVTKFRRHVAMLRPSHIVVYDELEASSPITWTFQLNSPTAITKLNDKWFKSRNDYSAGNAQMFCLAPMTGTVTQGFLGSPQDRENKYPNGFQMHFHAKMTTNAALSATRFLTVIEVIPSAGGSATVSAFPTTGTAKIEVRAGDYYITAQLDPTKASSLSVRDVAGTQVSLATGRATQSVTLGSEQRQAQVGGSTLMIERNASNQVIFQEAMDRLPDAVLYGNTY